MADLNTAEQDLLARMAEYGYRPGAIKWDTPKPMRFALDDDKHGKKSGWYAAFSDAPQGGAFGDMRTGQKVKWRVTMNGARPDDYDPVAHAAVMEEQRQKREAKLAALQAGAVIAAQKEWDEAGPPDPKHPYLVRKGISAGNLSGTAEIRQVGNKLVIPMKACEPGNPLVSLQYIYEDGWKQCMEYGQMQGTRATIGARSFKKDDPSQTIYICEGWATGWSIHQSTNAPVLVAWNTGNLDAVAEHAAVAYGSVAKLVIAADNDRWTRAKPEKPGSLDNPGRHYALEAAAKHGLSIALPDFKTLDGHPTDFNDLWMREGDQDVLHWLDPDRSSEARIAPEPDEAVPESDEEPADEPVTGTWRDVAPFRVLGHNRGTYSYLPKAGGQIVHMAANNHDRASSLFRLAPSSFWQAHFPSGSGVAWKNIADALMQAAHRKGIFQADMMRGRGCWVEEDDDGSTGVVLHLGDRMMVPHSPRYVQPDTYDSPDGYMYERLERKRGPHKKAMTLDESRDLFDLFCALKWSDEASGALLAGWTVLAPICGALSWRPHVWVTGERGSGKSSVIADMVVPLLAGMGLPVVGNTSEAGIRQKLYTDAFPVVFDEAEEDDTAGKRIQGVLALARQSSSESTAQTLKGTAGGVNLGFRTRSMFLLASIGGAINQEADKSRFCMLSLLGRSRVSPEERSAHWARIQPRMHAVNLDMGRRLFCRTLGQLRSGMLYETIDTFRREGGTVLGDQRLGDQFGTLYAGSWLLRSDEPPTAMEAREMLGSEDLEEYQQEHMPEGKRALQIILQRRERVDMRGGAQTVAVGQLLDMVINDGSTANDKLAADNALRQFGLKMEMIDGYWYLLVANSSEWVKLALRDTIYARSARTILRSLDGVQPHTSAVRFHPGLVSKATRVPYVLLDA